MRARRAPGDQERHSSSCSTATPARRSFPWRNAPFRRARIAGEHASPTQPFNTVIPALSPQALPLDSVWGPTAADRDACLAQIRPLRNEGIFTPPSLEGTLVVPSNIGGAHWGGVAYDPVRHLAVVPVNRIPAFVQLIPLEQLDTAEVTRNESRLGDQYTRMHGTPYVMRRRMLSSPSRAPCTPPPWGALVAIDLETGAQAWDVPLGDASAVVPRLTGASDARSARRISAGRSRPRAAWCSSARRWIPSLPRVRHSRPAASCGRAALPGGARATPMTYQVTPGGPQFVVVCVGGNEEWGPGDYVVAFALPDGTR